LVVGRRVTAEHLDLLHQAPSLRANVVIEHGVRGRQRFVTEPIERRRELFVGTRVKRVHGFVDRHSMRIAARKLRDPNVRKTCLPFEQHVEILEHIQAFEHHRVTMRD